MSLEILKEKDALEDLKSEIKHLKMCDHPNIIKLRDERRTNNNHYLFFDFCNLKTHFLSKFRMAGL